MYSTGRRPRARARAGRAGPVTAWSGPRGCRSRCCRRSRWPSCGGRRRRAWPPGAACALPAAAGPPSPASAPSPAHPGPAGASLVSAEGPSSPPAGRGAALSLGARSRPTPPRAPPRPRGLHSAHLRLVSRALESACGPPEAPGVPGLPRSNPQFSSLKKKADSCAPWWSRFPPLASERGFASSRGMDGCSPSRPRGSAAPLTWARQWGLTFQAAGPHLFDGLLR